MTLRLQIYAVVAVLLGLACSQHVPAGPDEGDHTPPGVSSVVAWDKYHTIVTFNERVSRETADNAAHYAFGEQEVGPRGSIVALDAGAYHVFTAVLHEDNRTVTLTTDSLVAIPYTMRVKGVADLHGNAITRTVQVNFEGTNGADVTPPEITLQSPAPDATASTGGFIAVGFSEGVTYDSFIRAFHVSGDGAQIVSIRSDDVLHFTCDLSDLHANTVYTVSLNGVTDFAGNTMPLAEWSFMTESTSDVTAPTVVSSRPAPLAVSVDTGTQLSFSFSEPMDPYSVIMRPHVDFDAARWSNGGRKVTFETTWLADTQYTIQIRPGDMRDLAGNRSTTLYSLVFSTGSALATGSFSGSVGGDPASTNAKNAAGALVYTGRTGPFDLYTSIVTRVDASGAYEMPHLVPGTYSPFCVLDSNHDKIYQPLLGDAVAIFGVSNWWGGLYPVQVPVGTSPVRGIGLSLYDPTAVYGLLTYSGSHEGPIRVGLFATANFDPMTSVPVVSVFAGRIGVADYAINSLETGPIADGDYYVAAYLDIGANDVFDPAEDPSGVYGGATPIAVHVSGGIDSANINISLTDPGAAINARAARWPLAPGSGLFERFLAIETAAD